MVEAENPNSNQRAQAIKPDNNNIEEMNKKSEWLELENTHFITPSGLDDPEHYSTPHDLGIIMRYAFTEHPEILTYMGKKGEHSVFPTENNESHWWSQISSMLSTYPGMDGVKTGYTWEAGNTFLGTAIRDGKRIGVVVFNTQDAPTDLKTLFDYGFRE